MLCTNINRECSTAEASQMNDNLDITVCYASGKLLKISEEIVNKGH